MSEGSHQGLPLPVDPVLREVAVVVEELDRFADILDSEWRSVYLTSQFFALAAGELDPASVCGMSLIERAERHPELMGWDQESQRRWWEINAAYMRWTLEPDAPQFGSLGGLAARVDPIEPPAAWGEWFESDSPRFGSSSNYILNIRLNSPGGDFAGVLILGGPRIPATITGLLARGDIAMYERMAQMTEPHRCPSAVLFCDIESSGELSRRLSSRAYFDLIRSMTTAIDQAVAEHGGILGRHAGDGASAFFSAKDFAGSETAASRAAIEAVRALRESVRGIDAGGKPVALNSGVHWGGTIVMGQVSEGGRLEVTALGDEVNEAARIEGAAKDGTALASKHLIERLEPADAEALGLDLGSISYRTVASLEGAGEKSVRDAGAIPVTEI